MREIINISSKSFTPNIMINLTYILMSPLKKNMLTELKMISLISKLLHFLLKTMKRRLCKANIDFLMNNYYVCIFVEDIGYHVVSGLPSWMETHLKAKRKNKMVGIRLRNNVNIFNISFHWQNASTNVMGKSIFILLCSK